MRHKKIVLVSAPWPVFNRPSLQLGALKAYMKGCFPDLEVAAHHFYLKVAWEMGYRLYQAVARKIWLAETVYAALLFPERFTVIEKLYNNKKRGYPDLENAGFADITRRVKEISLRFIADVEWKDYGAAGFSICLSQLTASLYLIKEIKRRFPDIVIVTGGSAMPGRTAMDILQVFKEIDYAVIGEGEGPLSRLIGFLYREGDSGDMPAIPGVITRQTSDSSPSLMLSQLETLEKLPVPDYSDYFALLQSLGAAGSFFPALPMEMSRGCWWQNVRPKKKKSYSGCAFCNLNNQWRGYRSKTPEQSISEIESLTAGHQSLSMTVSDNTPPVRECHEIFTRIRALNKDLEFFCELRASIPKKFLSLMKAGGMNSVQVGIEALSKGLLQKLNKGTTVIQNLEIMKNCEEMGIVNNSNLILCFPGSDADDVAETLDNIEYAKYFRPLKCVVFRLGLGSPVSENPTEFGIGSVFNHPNYAALFPRDIFRSVKFTVQGYMGDLGYQKKLWQAVRQKVEAWSDGYAELHRTPYHLPILSYRDGRDFLIIKERRLNNEAFTHRITGTARVVYLYCRSHRSIRKILAHFPGLTEEKLVPFLKMMTEKKLMFHERGKYLSLAVSATYRCVSYNGPDTMKEEVCDDV